MGPRIRRASWRSLGIMVTRFAWIAHKLQSSKRCTRKSSVASWIARRLSAVYRKGSGETSLEISRTRRQNGAFRIKSSVLFWNFRISFRASVPGLYLRRFLSGEPSASTNFADSFLGFFFPFRWCFPCNFRDICTDMLSEGRYKYYRYLRRFGAVREVRAAIGE